MTAFFVLTDRFIVGPLTGVELREAALAGILRHDGIVGGSKDGPWYAASDVGLFSEKKTPLPHPPDVHVPQYQVRGMPGAFQGPFKLRELIGFASRGMLPPEALLQADDSEEWIEVRRYRMLAAVLAGELVLVDQSGNVVVRNALAGDSMSEEARAPIELAKSADMTHATSLAPEKSDDDVEVVESWNSSAAEEVSIDDQPSGPSKLAELVTRLRARVPNIQISISPRLAIQALCLMLIFVGVASAFSYWKQIGLQPEQVIGDWLVADSDGRPVVGLSLREDGQCVIFNTRGHCWTGDYVWDERDSDAQGFQHIAPFSTVLAQIDSRHVPGAVEATDGYIRLQGFVKTPPQFDGKDVRDLFLRRTSEGLQVGYLASVHWTEDAKQMEAGWLQAVPYSIARPDIALQLRKIEIELPIPTDQFAGETPQHVSEAIDTVSSGVTTKVDGETVTRYETLAYSNMVDAAYLLQEFGLPDEARRIFRFEIPKLRNGPTFDGAQVVRYDDLQFILSDTGKLRYLMLAPEMSVQ